MKFVNQTLADQWTSSEIELKSIYKAWAEMPTPPKRGTPEFAHFDTEMESKIRKPSIKVHQKRISILVENTRLLKVLKNV